VLLCFKFRVTFLAIILDPKWFDLRFIQYGNDLRLGYRRESRMLSSFSSLLDVGRQLRIGPGLCCIAEFGRFSASNIDDPSFLIISVSNDVIS